MKEVKMASADKILACVIDGQLVITDRVQAPEGKDLSEWLEFNNELEARFHYGMFEKEDEEFGS